MNQQSSYLCIQFQKAAFLFQKYIISSYMQLTRVEMLWSGMYLKRRALPWVSPNLFSCLSHWRSCCYTIWPFLNEFAEVGGFHISPWRPQGLLLQMHKLVLLVWCLQALVTFIVSQVFQVVFIGMKSSFPYKHFSLLLLFMLCNPIGTFCQYSGRLWWVC